MTAAADPAFIGDVPPRRRSAQPAPLDVWVRAVLLALTVYTLASAWFVFGQTPMPVAVDTELDRAQFADLDRQVRAYRAAGQEPLTVVFLGTSRMRNVALDSAAIAAAARRAGVTRPVASTVIGVNWGSFQRLAPALPMIERRKPDAIVVMPELLTEDFTRQIRMHIGTAWLQSLMSGEPFSPFAVNETTMQVCLGFTQSAAERDDQNDGLMARNFNGPGPRLARAFLKRMAAQGTRVLVTDVPVSRELEAERPEPPLSLAAMGLAGPGVEKVSLAGQVDRAAYCDAAHIEPPKADAWRDPFFRAIAGRLNALPR